MVGQSRGLGRMEERNPGLLAAQRLSVCAEAAKALCLSTGIAEKIYQGAQGQPVGQGGHWHGVVAEGQYQRQVKEAGAGRGESTCLSARRKLKEQERQMKKEKDGYAVRNETNAKQRSEKGTTE